MWKVILLILALGSMAHARRWRPEITTGLCIVESSSESCPSRIQNYGVCCEINGQIQEFQNYCFACKSGCEEWWKKPVKEETCQTLYG